MLETVQSVSEETAAAIAAAFAAYPYEEGEQSQFRDFKNQERVQAYIRQYIHNAAASDRLYTWKDRGYVYVTDENTQFSFRQSLGMLKLLVRTGGWHVFWKEFFSDLEPGQETLLRQHKKPYYHVEMVAVLPEYQKQGVLKRLLGEVEDWARRDGCRVILETDNRAKAQMYEHLGYELKGRRFRPPGLCWYDLCRDFTGQAG